MSCKAARNVWISTSPKLVAFPALLHRFKIPVVHPGLVGSRSVSPWPGGNIGVYPHKKGPIWIFTGKQGWMANL